MIISKNSIVGKFIDSTWNWKTLEMRETNYVSQSSLMNINVERWTKSLKTNFINFLITFQIPLKKNTKTNNNSCKIWIVICLFLKKRIFLSKLSKKESKNCRKILKIKDLSTN